MAINPVSVLVEATEVNAPTKSWKYPLSTYFPVSVSMFRKYFCKVSAQLNCSIGLVS